MAAADGRRRPRALARNAFASSLAHL